MRKIKRTIKGFAILLVAVMTTFVFSGFTKSPPYNEAEQEVIQGGGIAQETIHSDRITEQEMLLNRQIYIDTDKLKIIFMVIN